MTGRDIFIYQAACYCEACGDAIRARLTAQGKAPAEPLAESTYDSDDFPKGPYSEGGGESDTPQHCDACGDFLENPLTRAGVAYVADQLQGEGAPEVLRLWRDFYADELADLASKAA